MATKPRDFTSHRPKHPLNSYRLVIVEGTNDAMRPDELEFAAIGPWVVE